MRFTSRADGGFPDGLRDVYAQLWRSVPELAVGGTVQERDQRLFLGSRVTRHRKQNTDPAGRVITDVSESYARSLYVRLPSSEPWSLVASSLASAAVTVVTVREPAEADLSPEDLRADWDLGDHWIVTRSLVLTTRTGDRETATVDFLGPPRTEPGDDVTWVSTESYRTAL